MTELVFGIDHGNGNMKSQSVCIPCGVVRYSSEPGRFMNEDILEYQGSYYTLSDTRMPYKSDKTADNEYFILTLFILAMEAKNRNVSLDGREVLLGIGVPPADFSQQAGKFKQYFLDEAKGGVTFKWNGSGINFYIKDVQVSPQNFAAVFCYKASLFKQYRTVNCIDIGDGTVDLLVIRKGQPDLSVRVSERLGIAVLRSEIANAIQQNYGLQLESSDVEQVLMKEPTVLDAEVIAEIHRLADEWMIRIINKLHTYVPDFRINPTVFLGGGSFVLHDQIKASPDFKYIEFIDNINANAVGYAMLVKAKLKRQ
jgi:plasmid segregation protein ParM